MVVAPRRAASPVTHAMVEPLRATLLGGLARLNGLAAAEAESGLLRCCGSIRWTRTLAAMRPFETPEALLEVAQDLWNALLPDDWRQAFAAHPRIGERLVTKTSPAATWSANEQAGVESAGDDVRAELARLNRTYEEKFDHMFIVCASGLDAGEMLARCRERMRNSAEQELVNAAAEQARITEIRLVKLLTELGANP
jgi:OHCU decarboxylase